MSPIRILIADDHSLFRRSLACVLSAQPDFEVVGQAANGEEALNLALEVRPDLFLIDINMPGLSSFDAVRRVRMEAPQIKILFVSMHDDQEYLTECMELRADAYILKDTDMPLFMSALREVSQGGNFLSPRMVCRLVNDIRISPNSRVKGGYAALSPRERQVLKLSAEGKSAKDIATGLDLSVKTVEAHKFNLMRKLSIHNKAQLVHYAIAKKVIQLH